MQYVKQKNIIFGYVMLFACKSKRFIVHFGETDGV